MPPAILPLRTQSCPVPRKTITGYSCRDSGEVWGPRLRAAGLPTTWECRELGASCRLKAGVRTLAGMPALPGGAFFGAGDRYRPKRICASDAVGHASTFASPELAMRASDGDVLCCFQLMPLSAARRVSACPCLPLGGLRRIAL